MYDCSEIHVLVSEDRRYMQT